MILQVILDSTTRYCVSTSDIYGHTSGIHSNRSSATMVVPQVINSNQEGYPHQEELKIQVD